MARLVQPADDFSQGGVQGRGGRVAGLAGQHAQREFALLRPVQDSVGRVWTMIRKVGSGTSDETRASRLR